MELEECFGLTVAQKNKVDDVILSTIHTKHGENSSISKLMCDIMKNNKLTKGEKCYAFFFLGRAVELYNFEKNVTKIVMEKVASIQMQTKNA